MSKRIFMFIFGIVFTSLIIFFVGLQVISLADMNLDISTTTYRDLANFKVNLDYKTFFDSKRNETIFKVCGLLTFATALMITNVFDGAKVFSGTSKGKIDKDYNHLAGTYEMKRGLLRVEWNRDKEITRKTIRCFLDKTFNWAKKIQNRIRRRFQLPRTKDWNTIKIYKYPKEGADLSKKQVDFVNQYHRGGVPIRAERLFGLFGPWSRIYYLVGQDHNLFVGATGRGKSQTFVLPMLFSYIDAGECFVAHDPKAELISYAYDELEKKGYQILRIDWTNPHISEGWNPLWLAWERYKQSFEDARADAMKALNQKIEGQDQRILKLNEKVQMLYVDLQKVLVVPRIDRDFDRVDDLLTQIKYLESVLDKEIEQLISDFKTEVIPTNIDASEAIELVLDVASTLTFTPHAKDPFWSTGGSEMITGAALFLMEQAISNPVIEKRENGETVVVFPLEKYINFKSIMFFYEPLMHMKSLDEVVDFLGIDKASESISHMLAFISASGVTRNGLKATFNNAIMMLTATKQISEMTSHNTFDFNSIFTKKTAVFLNTHDEKSTYYKLVTIFFRQLYEAGVKITRDNPRHQKLDIPMNFLIDEMGVLPPIRDIQGFYAAARSREIRIHAFVQSFAQLQEAYGDRVAAIIEDNSNNQIFLGGSTLETVQKFSKKAGQKRVFNKAKNDWVTTDVVTPEYLTSFQHGKFLVTSIERKPIVSHLPMFSRYRARKKIKIHDPKVIIEKNSVEIYDHVIKKEEQRSLVKKVELENDINTVSYSEPTEIKQNQEPAEEVSGYF